MKVYNSLKTYCITAKHNNWLPDHPYVLVTFDVLAYSTKEAREIGERRCTQFGVKYMKTRKREFACDYPAK